MVPNPAAHIHYTVFRTYKSSKVCIHMYKYILVIIFISKYHMLHTDMPHQGEKDMEKSLKRISLLIREDQHQKISDLGLSTSGLVRDLIDDYFSEHRITLSVSEQTRQLYNKIIANSGGSDAELEQYFRNALSEFLTAKIEEMQNLQNRLKQQPKS